MSKFKCYQTNQTTNVVVDGEGWARESVVTISRAVGTERARLLTRLCAAVLNEDYLSAPHELDLLDREDAP